MLLYEFLNFFLESNMNIKHGIQTIDNFNNTIKGDSYKKLERASDSFIEKTKGGMGSYFKKWTGGSFHQWSRKGEYPFIYQEISNFVDSKSSKNLKILDAGSGVTFFPYYIMEKHKEINIRCLDMDESYVPLFEYCNFKMKKKLNLDISSMQNTEYGDNEFDVIYSISVIEHTTEYTSIIKEFRRILKPDGLLILTFDISIDGIMDIPINKSIELLGDLNKYGFTESDHSNHLDFGLVDRKDIYNTKLALDIDSKSLWAPKPNFLLYIYRVIKEFFNHRRLYQFPPELTFYCSTFFNSKKRV